MLGLSLGLGIGTGPVISGGGGAATTWDTAFNAASWTFSGGSLAATATTSTNQACRATKSQASNTGNGQFTITYTAAAGGLAQAGIIDSTVAGANAGGFNSKAITYASTGNIYFNSTTVATGLPTWALNDVITVYKIGNLVGFAKNGTPINGFNTSTGAGGTDISSALTTVYPSGHSDTTSNAITANFTGW